MSNIGPRANQDTRTWVLENAIESLHKLAENFAWAHPPGNPPGNDQPRKVVYDMIMLCNRWQRDIAEIRSEPGPRPDVIGNIDGSE